MLLEFGLKAAAAQKDLECRVVELDSQFRCGGSDAYLRWVVCGPLIRRASIRSAVSDTAQGFEYDWSGVIIRPGLIWRENGWVVDRAASKDPALRKGNGKTAASDFDVDRLIRNTYKVFLTRGMVGTVIYSTDPETRAELRELLRPGMSSAPAVSASWS